MAVNSIQMYTSEAVQWKGSLSPLNTTCRSEGKRVCKYLNMILYKIDINLAHHSWGQSLSGVAGVCFEVFWDMHTVFRPQAEQNCCGKSLEPSADRSHMTGTQNESS